MAVIHNMASRRRKTEAALFRAKSILSGILLTIGGLFSAVTAVSIVLLLANLLLGRLLHLGFMQARIIQALYRYAKMWTELLGNFAVNVVTSIPWFIDDAPAPRTWLELIKVQAPLLLGLILIVGVPMAVFRFGTILRHISGGLNQLGGGKEGGLRGEREALKLLKELPNDTHVFVNLEFEKRGHHETDFIIVAPAGVTVCEVKYWSGHVIYDPYDDRNVRRISKHGDSSQAHSPVHQVTAHYETLRDALRDQGINANPRGMVLMMHPDVSLENFQYCHIPVLEQPSIKTIMNLLGNAHLSAEQINQNVRALEKIAV